MDQQERRQSANELWRRLEPYHAVVYFAPEHRHECDRAGLRGGWMAYFASRTAPLGPTSPAVVAAIFFGFHPDMVARALPDAWSYATPDRVLEARRAGVDTALRRILDTTVDQEHLWEAALLAASAVADLDGSGRPLFSANAALPWPDPPHLALWQAATLLREHRGDGHVATLTAEGVSGPQAHVLQVASGANRRDVLQPNRGFSDRAWDTAADQLRTRGLLDLDENLTDAGRGLHGHIEQRTDLLAAAAVDALGPRRCRRLLDLLEPIAARAATAGAVPYPNPMGVPRPDHPQP